MIVTSVVALTQKTFPPGEMQRRTRRLARGEKLDPLDLVEFLEDSGYEPEAQVTQKGDIALRGGILDLWPLTSPWPVRLEFFRERIGIPAALRSGDADFERCAGPKSSSRRAANWACSSGRRRSPRRTCSITWRQGLCLCCASRKRSMSRRGVTRGRGRPTTLSSRTGRNARRKWRGGGGVVIQLTEAVGNLVEDLPFEPKNPPLAVQGLEVFRPIGDHRPEPHIAEAQRKEFFGQVHRWLRQDYAVHVFCNNDGERQRFEEIWWEYGLGHTGAMQIHLGALARGFLCEVARLVVVTDAEIFGRYKAQRARRLKAPHAQYSRSLLDINFSELEEGSYVVHLQHGIGKYLGLQALPTAQGRKGMPGEEFTANAGAECLVIEYAPNHPTDPPPKLYVPVSEAYLVSKYVGAGRGRRR